MVVKCLYLESDPVLQKRFDDQKQQQGKAKTIMSLIELEHGNKTEEEDLGRQRNNNSPLRALLALQPDSQPFFALLHRSPKSRTTQ